MLESVVGFLAKVAFWAFLVGVAFGIYLGVHYTQAAPAAGGDASCVAPAFVPGDAGPSG